MGKSKRIKAARRKAIEVHNEHPSDPRGVKGIARAIRRHDRVAGGPFQEDGMYWSQGEKRTTIKSKRRKHG